MAYQSNAKLSAITQEMSLNRSGLVADAIFPPVQTAEKFSYIDWTAELKDLKSVQDHVTCKSDANEIDTGALELKHGATHDRALIQTLDECKVVICGVESLDTKIAAKKTQSLTNKLLIGREERAIALATDVSKYTDNTTKAPYDEGAVIDGGLFTIDEEDYNDPAFDLRKYFSAINENALFGYRNVLVASLADINHLLTHPKFLGAGCIVDPKTTVEKVANLMGLSKIVVADAIYNDGIGDTVSLKKLWPKGTLLFLSSADFITSEDPQFAFGITAYSQMLQQNTWNDPKKGKGKGQTMQKIGHDMTEVVLSYKAATLVKVDDGE